MFRYASRIGVVNTPNPVRDACVPTGKSSADTYAYGLDEIMRMLVVLPQPPRQSLRWQHLPDCGVESFEGCS